MAKAFLDTNVLVYANDERDPRRRELALTMIAVVAGDKNGCVSTQVLAEYSAVAFRKLHQSPSVIDEQVTFFAESFAVVQVSTELIRRAIELKTSHPVSFYDGLILAAAESAGCEVLYSEDLNAGQIYAGVRVVNPFAE